MISGFAFELYNETYSTEVNAFIWRGRMPPYLLDGNMDYVAYVGPTVTKCLDILECLRQRPGIDESQLFFEQDADERFTFTARLAGNLSIGSLGTVGWINIRESDDDYGLGIGHAGFKVPDLEVAKYDLLTAPVKFEEGLDFEEPYLGIPLNSHKEIRITERPLSEIVELRSRRDAIIPIRSDVLSNIHKVGHG